MELIINHRKKEFTTGPASLEALLQLEIPDKSKGIAVAVNQQVIPKAQWPSTVLRDQDSILIITATQGG